MKRKEIYLAGGCFWGMQGYFDKISGVLDTEVGYINGSTKITSYKEVCDDSGHAEVVKVAYNSEVLSELDIFNLFIRVIEPYSINKQGGDIGVQYRTGIYSNDVSLLEQYKDLLLEWENLNKKSALEIMSIKNYCKAELDHQKYLANNPSGYCHINLNEVPKKFIK